MKPTKLLTFALVIGVGAYAAYKISEEAAVMNANDAESTVASEQQTAVPDTLAVSAQQATDSIVPAEK